MKKHAVTILPTIALVAMAIATTGQDYHPFVMMVAIGLLWGVLMHGYGPKEPDYVRLGEYMHKREYYDSLCKEE